MEEESFSFIIMLIATSLTVAGIFLLRTIMKGKQFTENTKATGKVIVITGANSGIGEQLARELNLRKGKVYMFCRNEDKAFEAKLNLVKYGCDATRLIAVKCDLCDISSINNAVKEFEKMESVLDILVNNAGVMFIPKYELTTDKCETTWQANYLGHFVLTEKLLPLLEKSDGGRIVNVSSLLHERCSELDVTKVNEKASFGTLASYNRSKLAQVMHARELTKRLRGANPSTKVTINSCHPGVVDTNLSRHTLMGYDFVKMIATPFTWLFMKTPQDGAQCSLFLALSTKVDGISGKYFSDCKEKTKINPLVFNDALCSELYDYSKQYVSKSN
uniref:Dehydrogenase/reductase SDR family member 13-like n=1 Tax=Rhabditophanes sp. KR3021 TaxID=114890 RepID=A0AC35U7J8_9BILA